jgi:pimeloyl-ACP methyl ester carboxylesterase
MPDRSSPIVLIHGLWMTALWREHWSKRYTAKGHRVIAKSWPGMDIHIENCGVTPLLSPIWG